MKRISTIGAVRLKCVHRNMHSRQWYKPTPRAEGIEAVPDHQLASCAETGPSPPQDQGGIAYRAKLSKRLIRPIRLPSPPATEPPTPAGWRLPCQVHGSRVSAHLVGEQIHSGGEKGPTQVRSDGNLNGTESGSAKAVRLTCVRAKNSAYALIRQCTS